MYVHGYIFYGLTPMLMSKNVNNDVSMNLPISVLREDLKEKSGRILCSRRSVPCKLLEHIYRSIMLHLNSSEILVDAQHGFCPGRSRETQLINTVEHLARSVNDRNQTDLLISDFS